MIYLCGENGYRWDDLSSALERRSLEYAKWAGPVPPEDATVLVFSDIPEWAGDVAIGLPKLLVGEQILPPGPEDAWYQVPANGTPEQLATLVSWIRRGSAERPREIEHTNKLLQEQTEKLREAMDRVEQTNQIMREELALASELQKSLLPKSFPPAIPLSFSHRYIPFMEVGGDFFEVIRVDPTHVGIIITDVSGHGLASAFLTSMFKSSFLHYAHGERSPARTLTLLNEEFSRTINTEHYLTGFYAVINTDTFECSYCNAGHPNQILVRPDGSHEELGTLGFFIGMFEGTEYEEKTVQLAGGDRILFFTDGIMETPDDEGIQFGREGILSLLKEHAGDSLETVSNTMIRDLIFYMGSAKFDDDITFLLTEVIDNLEEL